MIGRLAVLICLVEWAAWAQLSPAGGPAGPNRAEPLPLSGRSGQTGSVQTQQTSSPGAGVGTITSSVQVSGDFQGSVPAKDVPDGPVTLTLSDAVKRGLAANLGPISAGNAVAAARASRRQALSNLLPNIAANVSETITQIDLAAYGFQFKAPANLNFSIPTVVGPFAYSQAQGTLSQSVVDLVQRRNWQVSKESEKGSLLTARDARETVVLAVAGTYLQSVTTVARVASQQAQVENAQAVYNQAVIRKQAGTNAKIDVTRSLVELQTEQQRLSSLQSDLRKQKITLARLIGLPLDRELTLIEILGSANDMLPDSSTTLQRAFARRADLQAAESQVRAAEIALSSAHAERMPSVSLNGDYGVIGPNPTSTHGVFAITAAVNVPIWEGGRTRADIQQAEITLAQRRAELADQRGQVEQQVRNALIELETAIGQVRLSTSNRAYAAETLTEARDRFSAGVATTLEVVQAQQQVAGAESDYISSLFSLNLAKLTLARASGEAETALPDLLKGNRP